MEIDFLGLNSSNSCNTSHRQSSQDAFTDSGNGELVETSLSLSTSSSLDSQREIILNFREKKQQLWEFPYNNKVDEQPNLFLVRPAPVLFQTSSTTVFPYDLNDTRGISELPAASPAASLAMLYSTNCPKVFNDKLQEKAAQADTNLYAAGNSSTGISGDGRLICKRSGYIPTIAMARRATLARFLEKRLHRMNRARASHLMRKSSEICNRLPISKSNSHIRP